MNWRIAPVSDRVLSLTYRASFVALPIVAGLGLLVPLAVGLPNFTILGLYLAVPIVLAPAVVWRVRHRRPVGDPVAPALDWRLVAASFHLLVSLLVLLVVAAEVRPIGFYVGIAGAFGLVLLLVTTTSRVPARDAIVLYHAAILTLLVIFSVTLNYDFFVGRTDLTTHVALATHIVETGVTPAFPEVYEPFLLWHVYTAMATYLFGGWVPTHVAMYVLSGFVFAVGVPAMYTLTRRLHPDHRVATLSSLVMIGFPMYTFYGMYSIPRSVTSILFLLLLFVLVCPSTPRMRALSLSLLAAIVVYHPVTIPFVAVILVALYVVERVLGVGTPVVDRFTLLSAMVLTAIYWLFRAEFLVTAVVGAAADALFGPSGDGTEPSGVIEAPWAEVANYLPYSFLMFFVLVGFLFWLRDERSARTALGSLTVLTIAFSPLVFPGPALLLDALVDVNVGRFAHYTFMFVALTAGVGLFELLRRGGMATFFVLLVVVTCFSFAAVSNDFVASDNPVVERPFYTYYLTEQERDSFETVDDVAVGSIGTDRPSCRYMLSLHAADCDVIVAEEGSEMFDEHDAVLIREHESEKRPLQFTEYVDSTDLPRDGLTDRHKVYDSGAVSYYT